MQSTLAQHCHSSNSMQRLQHEQCSRIYGTTNFSAHSLNTEVVVQLMPHTIGRTNHTLLMVAWHAALNCRFLTAALHPPDIIIRVV